MIPDGVYLAGIGTYLPPVRPVAEMIARGEVEERVAAPSGWTGVAVADDVPGPDMAVAAGRQALRRAGVHGDDVALLLHACGTHAGPDGWPVHSYVQRHTIGGSAFAVELRQNCNALLAGMHLACGQLAVADRPAALVTGGDNFGHPLADRWRYALGAGTNRPSVLGDSAAAAVLSTSDGFAELLAINGRSVPGLEIMYRDGLPLFPPPPTVGRQMDLGARLAHYRARDPEGFHAAKAMLAEARTALAKQTLAEAGIGPDDVRRVAHVFSGGQHYIDAVLRPLGIDPARGMLELGSGLGHLSVSDQIVALDHLLDTGALGPGDHVLLMSNGGGSLMCVALRILRAPPWLNAEPRSVHPEAGPGHR